MFNEDIGDDSGDTDVDMESDTDQENQDPLESAKEELIASWRSFSPLAPEKEIQKRKGKVVCSGLPWK